MAFPPTLGTFRDKRGYIKKRTCTAQRPTHTVRTSLGFRGIAVRAVWKLFSVKGDKGEREERVLSECGGYILAVFPVKKEWVLHGFSTVACSVDWGGGEREW